ncbi:Rieske [2Fe-2S] domain protein [Planctomycetes bacterium Poly30]|uniref:Rieske [2Fe-2S] domain protein n=1 Tax=Saltatorellus ferox TaxID=2528018 RepID=A0A518F175_9BACT|nr:Rieske [2Fe-2S] domain protein [Planctomycetes bacterium Poly30]
MKPVDPEEPAVFRTEMKAEDVRDRGRLVETPRGRLALILDRPASASGSEAGDILPSAPRPAGKIMAVDPWCPHIDGPLWEGSAVGGEIACPWHRWRFSLATGRCTWAPRGDAEEAAETKIQVYRTRQSADGFVEILFAEQAKGPSAGQIPGQLGFD